MWGCGRFGGVWRLNRRWSLCVWPRRMHWPIRSVYGMDVESVVHSAPWAPNEARRCMIGGTGRTADAQSTPAAAPQAAVVTLTPANFDEVVSGDSNVLVKFYAPWCGHCKNMAPEYEIAGETFKAGDGVVIAKVDADAERDLGERFEVKGFPTIKWFPKVSQSGPSNQRLSSWRVSRERES